VVSALLLNLVHLEPGEAIYLGAGNLHAYLRGAGVEIMASSDNVLRGGLTKKHVDVGELLRVLDFGSGPVPKVLPRVVDEHEKVYDTEAREFRLSVVTVHGDVERDVHGPEILLVTSGDVSVASAAVPTAGRLGLSRGESAFVSADEERLSLAGEGIVYRASVNLG
jgi:mannose-6-phosphate isomerase